jgi:prevent-host-death family protein
MPEIINITDAQQRFTDLVRELDSEPVYVTVGGKPKAVVVRYDVYEALVEKVEKLEGCPDALTQREEPARTGDDLKDYFEFLEPDAVRIKGHRLGIEHVLEYYLAGYNPDEIAREFPGLSLEKIYATITYYLRHRARVNAYLIRGRELAEQEYREAVANPSPLRKRLQAFKAQRVKSSMDEGTDWIPF